MKQKVAHIFLTVFVGSISSCFAYEDGFDDPIDFSTPGTHTWTKEDELRYLEIKKKNDERDKYLKEKELEKKKEAK